MTILRTADKILRSRTDEVLCAREPVTSDFELTFDYIWNAPVANPANVNHWNQLPNWGKITPFQSVSVFGNTVKLTGGNLSSIDITWYKILRVKNINQFSLTSLLMNHCQLMTVAPDLTGLNNLTTFVMNDALILPVSELNKVWSYFTVTRPNIRFVDLRNFSVSPDQSLISTAVQANPLCNFMF